MIQLQLSDREFHATLAGLRALQYLQDGGGHEAVEEIASNGGEIDPLDHGEISDLCERINAAIDVS